MRQRGGFYPISAVSALEVVAILAAATASLGVAGCCPGGFFPVYLEDLPSSYRLLANAGWPLMSLWRDDVCRVPWTVFAAGWNDEYIIVKQHPMGPGAASPDRSVANWYIIRISDDNVFGPLTEDEFVAKRTELGVPETLAFARVFKELE